MTGYKIRYGEYGYDCWGASEWFGWYEYNNVVYANHNKAIQIMEDAKEQFPDKEFEIYEVNIDG